MTIISFVCSFIFLILLLSGIRNNVDFLSPGRIFGMLWSFILGLVDFKFSRLQLQWSLFDWFLVLAGLFTFLIGIYFSNIINLEKPFLKVAQVRNKLREIRINESKLFGFIIFYFLLCFISFIIEWQIEGFIPLFTAKPDEARVMFGVFGINFIVNSIIAVLFLIVQYFILIEGNKKRKLVLIIVFVLSLGNYILVVQRYGFFIFLMMSFCFFYYSSRKINIKSIVIFLALILTLIFGVQSLRMPELVKGFIIYESKIKFSQDYAEFAIPYMYLSMNVENFVKYYSQISQHSYGFFTSEFATNLIGINYKISEYFNFYKTRLHISGYNTFPFYWAYYYDFGIAGISLIPFIIGFIISEIYHLLHRYPSVVLLVLYCVSFAVIMLSFNSDPLTRLDTMLPFFVVIFAQFFIAYKN